MASISWTEEAATWLEDIYNYIAQDDPDAAHRVVNGIFEKADILEIFLGSATCIERNPKVRSVCFCTVITGSPIF